MTDWFNDNDRALSPAQADALAELDKAWRAEGVGCQCEQHCRPCPQTAEYTLEYHAIHHCKSDETNPFGNRVLLLCPACAHHLWSEAAALVQEMLRDAGRHATPLCRACSKPVRDPRDVIPSTVHSPGGIR